MNQFKMIIDSEKSFITLASSFCECKNAVRKCLHWADAR